MHQACSFSLSPPSPSGALNYARKRGAQAPHLRIGERANDVNIAHLHAQNSVTNENRTDSKALARVPRDGSSATLKD